MDWPPTYPPQLDPELKGLTDLIKPVAAHCIEAGVSPYEVEALAELLAFSAQAAINNPPPNADDIDQPLALTLKPFGEISEHPTLQQWLQSLGATRSATDLQGFSLHLIDIAEHMALRIYGAKVPSMEMRADRGGLDARSVGLARHLRG